METTENIVLPNLDKKDTKSNKIFMILSALGIIFVLDDHVGTQLKLFTNIFPYNSFFMPMFVFISGYFFKIESLRAMPKYLAKKIKTFLLPFLFYNIFYLILSNILNRYTIVHWQAMLFDFVKICWTYGTPVDLCSPGWFVIMLFHVVCFYAIIRKIFYKKWNDIIVLIIFISLGVGAVFMSHNNYFDERYVLIIKMAFFTQFYQLGICYKKYIEKLNSEKYDGLIILFTVVINILLIYYYGENISFTSCAFMKGFLTNNYLLPTITSITGILFWLILSKKMTSILAENKLINFISSNTFCLMMNHLLAYNILNSIFCFFKASSFDISLFAESAWYQYLPIPQFGAFYMLFAIFAVLGTKKICCICLFKSRTSKSL